MSIYHEFQPTYLYIKEHRITGMKYLGKTTKDDPDTYLGSGTYWRRHIRTHGKKHVTTIWKQLFTDRESLIETALRLSKEHDVVNSEKWANLTVENGLDGLSTGVKFSPEHRSNLSVALKGKARTKEHAHNISKALMGRRLSSEARAAIAKGHVGLTPTAETRAKISKANAGKSRPDVAERNRIRWKKYQQAQLHQAQVTETSL